VLTNALSVTFPELTFPPNIFNDPNGLPTGGLNATTRTDELLRDKSNLSQLDGYIIFMPKATFEYVWKLAPIFPDVVLFAGVY
jgi:hypothetical protein